MKQRYFYFLLMSLLILLLIGGCAPQQASQISESGLTVTDGLGREVNLKDPVKRIISTAASNTEILYAIGAGDLIVGRDEFSNYPEEALTIESIGGGMNDYNMEKITALQPDLVLLAEINPPELVEALEKLNIPVFYLSNPDDFDGLYENLITVGQLTGHTSQAEALSASLKTRVETALAFVEQSPLRPSVFFELDASEPAKPWTSGSGTFVNYLITMAGAQNIAAEIESDWAQYSQENLLIKNPDIIILADAKWGTTPEMVMQRPGWEGLNAVQQGNIFPIDDDLTSRPGPRMVDGLEALVNLCHTDYKSND
jgi:iron complex transport system substrate-binding protein